MKRSVSEMHWAGARMEGDKVEIGRSQTPWEVLGFIPMPGGC